METYLKAGIYGVVLSIAVNLLMLTFGLGGFPPFLSAFIAVIAIIFFYKIENVKEALVVSLMSYFFSNSFFSAFLYGLLYIETLTEPVMVEIQFSVLDLIDLIFTPIITIIAAYLGVYIVRIQKIPEEEAVLD